MVIHTHWYGFVTRTVGNYGQRTLKTSKLKLLKRKYNYSRIK